MKLNSKIFNLGIVDIPDAKFTPGWRTWVGMIKRIAKLKGKYKGVKLYRPWQYFSNFQSWYLEQPKLPGWQMDKDLLSEGKHNLYSPDSCVFLPLEINQAITRHRGWKEVGGAYVPSLSFGGKIIEGPRFIDLDSARSWYIEKKKEWIETLIKKYQPLLLDNIINALRNYEF